MDKIQQKRILMRFVTFEACVAVSGALVRRDAFSGSVNSNGNIEIAYGRVELTLKSSSGLVPRTNVDATSTIDNVPGSSDQFLPNHVVINGTKRVNPLASSRPSTNKSMGNIQERPGTYVQALSEDAHEGKPNGSFLNIAQQQQGESSLSFPRSEQQPKSPPTQSINHDVVRRIPSALDSHHSSMTVLRPRSQNAVMILVLLTTMLVSVGFIFAVLFPELRHGIIDQINHLCQQRACLQQSRSWKNQPRAKRSRSVDNSNDFLSHFEVGEKLGEGAFGIVHAVFSRQEGKQFAAKMIDVMESDLDLIKEEVAILKRVQHASLTAGCFYEYHDQCFYYLVMPLYPGGDLSGAVSDYIETQGLLPEPLFARLFAQMTRGVAFVQSKQVVHRDIKPENFLLESPKLADPRNLVVVADFGMSAVLNAGGFLDEICGTPIFMSPELFKGEYEFKVDVFALGLSAYVLLTGEFAFKTEKEIKTWAASSDPPPRPPSISPNTQKMIEKSLARDASQRVNAQELEKLAATLISHSFDDVSIARRKSTEPNPCNGKGYRTMGITGGEMQKNKAARRNRMLWELITDHYGKTMDNYAGGANVSAEVLAARPFEIKQGRRNRMVSQHEFWSREECLKNHVSGIGDEDMQSLSQGIEIQSSDVQLLDDVLIRYNVDRDKWGQGKAKSITDLAKECRGGLCLLTENEKRLERVVEIVALVVMNREGEIVHQFPLRPKVALGKAGQRKTAALQTSFTEPRLPAMKRMAWETVHEATVRVLAALDMSLDDVNVSFDVPMQVVKEQSTSYLGLTTVYKKHMVEAVIREDTCSSDQLAAWGLPGSNKFVVKTKEGASNWGWLSQADAENLGTLDEGDEGLATRYAEVLPVKTKIINADRVKEMLKKTSAKVDDMSYDALEELAEQISTGEVELVEEEEPDGTRSLKRKVTITILRFTHQEGSILLEVKKSTDGGTTWARKNWLPAVKQHTFENPYYVARRLLTSRFMVAEGRWRIDKDESGCIIEESESDQLPGLPTIYTKNIVAARLCNEYDDPANESLRRNSSV